MNPLNPLACPTPVVRGEAAITLAHGEGGRLMHRLIAETILPRLQHPELARLGDAAHLPRIEGPIALSTDQFVVTPLFFPGGDIGRLAVLGTTNDLAVSGARPLWLSLALVIEEGLPLATLERVLESVAAAAAEVEVAVVAGDTKVVPRGQADQLFLCTAGIGQLIDPIPAGPAGIRPGDRLLVSGPIGQHGLAVLAAREQLGFEPAPTSDLGNLFPAADALRRMGPALRAMRDATRGGVAAVLHEWHRACGHSLVLDDAAIPVREAVRGICELLGLDPLHMANEGTLVTAVDPKFADEALDLLRRLPPHAEAAIIGTVQSASGVPVAVRRGLGRDVPLDEPLGAPLPRIC